MWLVVAAVAGGGGAYLTGEPAERVIEDLPGVSKPSIEEHARKRLYSLRLSPAQPACSRLARSSQGASSSPCPGGCSSRRSCWPCWPRRSWRGRRIWAAGSVSRESAGQSPPLWAAVLMSPSWIGLGAWHLDATPRPSRSARATTRGPPLQAAVALVECRLLVMRMDDPFGWELWLELIMTAFTHFHELAVGLDERLEILGACRAQGRQPRVIQLLAVLLPVRQRRPPRVGFSGPAERRSRFPLPPAVSRGARLPSIACRSWAHPLLFRRSRVRGSRGRPAPPSGH